MTKQFAPEYPRNSNNWIKFPPDSQYRKGMFPEEVNSHPAKANVYLVQAIIEYVSEENDILMDIMAGTGTLMVAALVGRSVICIEISEKFHQIQVGALEHLEKIAPGISGMISLINMPCQTYLPIPNLVNHIIFSPQYCIHPDTKVLKSDLTWDRASSLVVGDELVGFDKDSSGSGRGRGRKMRRSMVEAIKPTVEDAYLICLSNGEFVIASANHRWLESYHFPSGHILRWSTTASLHTGSRLKYLAKPWGTDSSHSGGYLQGIYDGESWVHRQTVGFGQNKGDTLDKVRSLLTEKGYYVSGDVNDKESQDTHRLYLERFQDSMRFLGSIRPERLLKDASKIWEGKEIRSRIEGATEVEVTRIIPLPKQELLHIQTSTETFIASGLLSHNSGILKKKSVTDQWNIDIGYDFVEYSTNPLNLGTMSEFLWTHEMERVYAKCFETIKPGGSMTLILKDHISAGKRIELTKMGIDASVRVGFSYNPEEHWKWAAPGMPYTAARRARGEATVDDESIIILRRS